MSYTPSCFFDVTDCTGNCCEEGRLMYDRYIGGKINETNRKLEYILEQAYILVY
jgi:hypothetical protein